MLEVHSVHQDLDTICFRAQSTLSLFLAQHASAILLTTQVLPELKVHESIHHDLTYEKRVKLSSDVHTMSNNHHPHTLPFTNTRSENPALKGPKNPTKRKNIVSIIYDTYTHSNNSMNYKEKGQSLIDILLTQLLAYNTTHTTSTGDHLATLYQSHISTLSAHISSSASSFTAVAQTTSSTTSLRAAVPVYTTKGDKLPGAELLGASDVCFLNDLVYKYHTVSLIYIHHT